MRFEYHTTFAPVDYHKVESRGWIFKEELPPYQPIIESLTINPAYEQHLESMGYEGWELVSVQPLLKGVWKASGYTGMGYSLTAGYYLFWKRALE